MATSNSHYLPAPPRSREAEGIEYIDFFRFLNAQLQPASYFEIGTQLGVSASTFQCEVVCVDPHFRLTEDLLAHRPAAHFYRMNSDEYFKKHDLRSIFPLGPDIAFLDGMHRADYLLRDFLNTELLCHERSLILLHDCVPVNSRMTLRDHFPGEASEGKYAGWWTGDVWKVVPTLKKFRPDLQIRLIDAAPTGLVAVQALKPKGRPAIDYFAALDFMQNLRFDRDALWKVAPLMSSRSLVASPEDLTMHVSIR
jgi:hypothetical protein